MLRDVAIKGLPTLPVHLAVVRVPEVVAGVPLATPCLRPALARHAEGHVVRALPELVPRASGPVFGLELTIVEVLARDGEGLVSEEDSGQEAEQDGEEEREAGGRGHLLEQLEEEGRRGKRL